MKWKTRMTTLLGIKYPIIQGGLAYLAYSELASAVSNAGGLGQITAMSMHSPEELKMEIQKTKELTHQPFGVNFAIGQHSRRYEPFLDVALNEGVPVISVTGGNPTPVFNQMEGSDVKKLVLVASKRQAVKAESVGADAVMVVGHEGGGHLGRDDVGTMVLVPAVVDSVSIPVIASGGISDGRGLMAALALGAEGVEMGTRFIVTKECVHAHPTYKEAIVNGHENDTVIIKRSLGAPGRTLHNHWTDRILEIEEHDGSYERLKEYISGEANKQFIYEGHSQQGFGWAGQAIGNIHDIPSVNELFETILQQAEEITQKWMSH